MTPVDMSGMAKYLGPGTGGLWMGEQQRNAMQESEIQQKRGLEDILTQQQNRDIAKQKLPFELQKAEQDAKFRLGQVAAQGTEAEDRLRKIKKEDFQEFTTGLGKMDPSVISPIERAAYLNDLIKRTGQDAEHPLVQAALRAHAQGGPNWDKFSQAILIDPKDRYKEEAQTARTVASDVSRAASAREVAQIGADSRIETARIRAEQAQARAAQVKESTDQLIARYTNEMKAEKDPARRQQLDQYIKYLQQGKMAIAQAVGSGKTDELERTLQMFQQGAMQAPPPKPLPTAPGAPMADTQATNPGATSPNGVPAAPKPAGATATAEGPNGVKIYKVNGKWVDANGNPI